MFEYTNKANVSLPLAVFLMYDSYDYDERPNTISATTLIKPVKQIVLARQNKELAKQVDVLDLVASRMGTAIHDGCEQAWTSSKNVRTALKVLGNSEKVVNKIVINPKEMVDGDIPVFVEQRHEKEIDGYIITGKYDLVLNGRLSDYKSTSVWTYIYDSNSEKYAQQGSIYKWLVPHQITDDFVDIQYIFTDWSASKSRQDASYPKTRVMTKSYPLTSVEDTERAIKDKLAQIERFKDSPQNEMPPCSDEDLWATDTVWKYYKNPNNKTRATKNFDNPVEANKRLLDDGSVGEVVEVKGQVKACEYCPVVGICEQAKTLVNEGRLLL